VGRLFEDERGEEEGKRVEEGFLVVERLI